MENKECKQHDFDYTIVYNTIPGKVKCKNCYTFKILETKY